MNTYRKSRGENNAKIARPALAKDFYAMQSVERRVFNSAGVTRASVAFYILISLYWTRTMRGMFYVCITVPSVSSPPSRSL